jgi:hypothetical protein
MPAGYIFLTNCSNLADAVGQSRRSDCAPMTSVLPDSVHPADMPGHPFRADSVAKVFLRHGTQIFRAVGAAIE